MKYIKYNKETGQILETGETQDISFIEVNDEEGILENQSIDSNNYYCPDGVPTLIPENVKNTLANRPSLFVAFDWMDKVWKDTRTTKRAQEQKIRYLEESSNIQMYGLIQYMGYEFSADQESVRRINACITMFTYAPPPADFYWLSADNVKVSMTYQQLVGLGAAMISNGWETFKKLQRLKDEVRSLTEITNIDAVTW